jgi:hypothetical protein
MKSFLANILSDDAGNASSARAVMLWVFAVVFVVWAAQSFRANRLAELPDSVVFVLATTLGAKVAQKKFAEGVSPDPTQATQPTKTNSQQP